MKTYFLLIILSFVLSLNSLMSQQDTLLKPFPAATSGAPIFIGVPSDIQVKVSSFFKTLIKSQVEYAFAELLFESPLKEKKDQLENLIQQTKKSVELYGYIMGYEPVNSDVITESLIRARYIALHSKYPMRWVFTFYKSPDKGWIIINIKFDDQMEYFFTNE